MCFRRRRRRRSSGSPPNPIIISEQRIYGPKNLGIGDDESSADRDLEGGIGEELLAKIRRCYGRVNLVDIGFCFGLLDPVSNIVVGEAIALSDISLHELLAEDEEQEEDEEDLPAASRPVIRCINQRSFDGLVAFLVALFPYLTDYRAMWYLNKADADPLVAARLVIDHRGMEETFGFESDATVAAVETALRCAAAAAQHPNPRQFALGWKLLSPQACLRKVATQLSRPYAGLDPPDLIDIISLLRQQSLTTPPPLAMEESWELSSRRLVKLNPPPEMPLTPTLRRMLLATIHGYYLQALAYLPKDKLRSHYHHSLLHAGHCYGPLDPVSNIVVNTLWYSQVYPLTLEKKVEIEAISTKALLRIAVRSLYGLISYLCTCYPALTPGEAMRRLQLAGADLQKAHDPSLLDGGVEEEEAYAAAAKAGCHPKPRQQAQFLGPSNSTLSAMSQLLMHPEPARVRPLLLDYFRTVIISSSKPAEETTKNINVLGPWDYSYVMGKIDHFWNQHNRAVEMAKSAIDLYNKQHGVPRYELHVICGVNEFVGGPVLATPFGRGHHFSHINFLATQQNAGARPELFFAECRKDGSGVGLCCPVAMPLRGTEQVRCPYCELAGSRIMHPAKESFRGRDREFDKMLAREGVYSEEDTNDDIISCSHKETLWVDYLEEDHIYGDYSCDGNIVEEKFPRDDMY